MVFLGSSGKIFPRCDGCSPGIVVTGVITVDSFAVTILTQTIRRVKGLCGISRGRGNDYVYIPLVDLNRTSGVPSQEKAYCIIFIAPKRLFKNMKKLITKTKVYQTLRVFAVKRSWNVIPLLNVKKFEAMWICR